MQERGEVALRWVDDIELEIRDTVFRATPRAHFGSTPDRFCVVKPPDLVRQYINMVTEHRPEAIVELGIFSGGSTALLNEIARPRKLVAIELEEERVAALDDYLEAHRATDSVKAY